jgi:DNA-binding transcriptional ArsR family regulator
VLGILGVVLLLIIAVSVFAPANEDSDLSPTTYNSGSAGTKAVYLLLGELGYGAHRWEASPNDLKNVDAAKTTLVLAEPNFPTDDSKEVQTDIADFLSRGGHVLATGKEGAYFLPGGKTDAGSGLYQRLCFSTPEGQGPLARAGKVSLTANVRWAALGPEFRVSQMCGNNAVVVSYHYGAGEAIWWSSPLPMSNRGLREDASLRLVLASMGGSDRSVLFDEYFHGERASLWDTAKGLPLTQIAWQCAVVALLLVLSFGRRNGPLRMPARLPRSSPLEFAESMGRLYGKAGATQAAVDGARRRLLKFLEEQCGVPREVLRSTPQAIVEALEERLGGRWSTLGEHLMQASETEHHAVTLVSTLELVKALDRDQRDLAERIRSGLSGRPILKGAN